MKRIDFIYRKAKRVSSDWYVNGLVQQSELLTLQPREAT